MQHYTKSAVFYAFKTLFYDHKIFLCTWFVFYYSVKILNDYKITLRKFFSDVFVCYMNITAHYHSELVGHKSAVKSYEKVTIDVNYISMIKKIKTLVPQTINNNC